MAREGRTRGGAGATAAARGALEDLLERTRSRSYFECLRVPPDVSTTGVRDAWTRVAAEFEALRAAASWTPEEADDLEEAGQVLHDAFSVLSDPDLRLAYRRALEP